jgi:hypothetical protein
MEGQATTDNSPSQSMGMLPKSNTIAYVIAIILLLIVLIGAVLLFAYINSQSAILPTASNTVPTPSATTTTPTPTQAPGTTASVEKPLNQQEAQTQLTQLQTLMNNYTTAEGTAYSSANTSVGQTSQESQEQTTFGSL